MCVQDSLAKMKVSSYTTWLKLIIACQVLFYHPNSDQTALIYTSSWTRLLWVSLPYYWCFLQIISFALFFSLSLFLSYSFFLFYIFTNSMAGNQEPNPLHPIDNELFHSYTRYQMCLLKNSTSFWSCDKQREAMLNILSQFESVDGSKWSCLHETACLMDIRIDTLRTVVNQIFENSSQQQSFGEQNKEPWGLPESSGSAFNLENHPSSSTARAAETSKSKATQERTRTNGIVASRTRSRESTCIQELPLAKKSNTSNPSIESLQQLISGSNLAGLSYTHLVDALYLFTLPVLELKRFTSDIERSKLVILTRMRRVDKSFKISGVNTSYSLHISDPLDDHRSPLSLCQSNLIAYRFGKLLEQEALYHSGGKMPKDGSKCFRSIKSICLHDLNVNVEFNLFLFLRGVEDTWKTSSYALFHICQIRSKGCCDRWKGWRLCLVHSWDIETLYIANSEFTWTEKKKMDRWLTLNH